MNLQHEVHYLNNQLNPILDGEEDGPNMEEDEDRTRKKWSPRKEMILSLTSIVSIMRSRLLST